MTFNDAEKKVVETVANWSKEKSKLVIGIDGITGVGKTTIADYLKQNNSDILLIHIDDFMSPLDFRKDEVSKLKDPTDFFTHSWFEYKELREIIAQFRSGENNIYTTLAYRNGKKNVPIEFDLTKSILVLEGILLFHPELLDDVWDKRIFLDGDEQEIKERRIKREKERWGQSYMSEDEPTSWFRFILLGLKLYKEKYQPHKKADLHLHISI